MDDRWDADGADELPAIDVDDLELELVGVAVRSALVRPIDPATAQRHVRLMVDAHRQGPARPRRAPRGDRQSRGAVRRIASPIVAGIAAAALVAAASADVLPSPVQRRMADAAAEIGIHLPGRGDRGSGRVTTPVLPTPTTPSTTPPTAPPTTAAVTVPPAPATTVPTAPTPTAPTPTTPHAAVPAPVRTTLPLPSTSTPPTTSTTPTTRPSTACVNPVLVSATATLLPGDRSVSVVITTTGTVPYMSATVVGMTGVVANLQPNPNGFTGTVTAPEPITAGSVLEFGSCGNHIRVNVVIQP